MVRGGSLVLFSFTAPTPPLDPSDQNHGSTVAFGSLLRALLGFHANKLATTPDGRLWAAPSRGGSSGAVAATALSLNAWGWGLEFMV